MFVIDASVTLSWYFADERSDIAMAALDTILDGRALAPGLWWMEVRNILIVSERRGRVDASDSAEILAHLNGLAIELDHAADSDHLMSLARVHRLSVYDAAYLELACRLALPIATLDRALAKAAGKEGTRLFSTS